MKNEFIPYLFALRMKALGFDEPCFTKFEDYFNKTKLHPILATLYLNTPYENEYNGYDQKIINDQSKRWVFTGYKNSVKDHDNDILSAPTFSQAFRWFREKYRLFPHIFSNEIGTFVWCIRWYVDNVQKDIPYKASLTYEEAELACLEKLIEIVEQKTNK